ncbi:AraC family transcriptional regulator [Frateuria aurantia]
MDLLSEVLALLNPHTSVFAGLKGGGDWAIDFPAPAGIKFNALIRGSCWLTVDGVEHAVQLQEGDGFLLPRRRAFSLRSDPSQAAVPADVIYRHARHGMAECGTGEDFLLIGGRFDFGTEGDVLFSGVPALVVLKKGSDPASVLNWALQRMAHELSAPTQGQAIVVQHLGHIMLVQVLRTYLSQPEGAGPGWLLAMADRRIAAVLHAIHARPAHRWTLQQLAAVAGVSRSTLALRFRQKAGQAPLEYVQRWRMQLAAQALKTSQAPVTAVAQKLGYDSDSAFSHAFRRVMGCSPSAYRRGLQVPRQGCG